MLGILLVDKPLGLTSHDVVNTLRRKLGTRRVGHAGTLDPLATGLLVVAVGPATRFLQYLPLEPKVYRSQITFGKTTNTQDAEGEVTEEKPIPNDLEAKLFEVIPSFLGLIDQLPPMFSAVKKHGQPLYSYARRGEEVERSARTVHIEEIDVHGLKDGVMEATVTCSGGTYLRTLANDIGASAGCGAYLSGLVRTQAGIFKLEDAVELDAADATHLMPLSKALGPMPMVSLNAVQEAAVRQGQRLGKRAVAGAEHIQTGFIALQDLAGDVFGVAKVEGQTLQPECVIPIEVASGQV